MALSNATAVKPTFTAPAGHNSLTFQLIVNDGSLGSSPSFVTIGVQNHAPVADAGPGQLVSVNAPVTLNGTGSSDQDSDALTYSWTQTSGSPVGLSGAGTAAPTFTAPAAAGTLSFELTVSDGSLTDSGTVSIVVVQPNRAPNASAGPDQSVGAKASVTLDGSGSSDPDGNSLTYSWKQTAGPAVALSDAHVARPAFVAPSGGNALTFQLTVSDGLLSDSAAMTVNVSADVKPAAKFSKRPQTKLLKARILAAQRAAIFRFSGSGKGKISFQCRLDKQKFASCRVRKSYKHLARGRHVFRVRARDASGRADLTLVTERFKI